MATDSAVCSHDPDHLRAVLRGYTAARPVTLVKIKHSCKNRSIAQLITEERKTSKTYFPSQIPSWTHYRNRPKHEEQSFPCSGSRYSRLSQLNQLLVCGGTPGKKPAGRRHTAQQTWARFPRDSRTPEPGPGRSPRLQLPARGAHSATHPGTPPNAALRPRTNARQGGFEPLPTRAPDAHLHRSWKKGSSRVAGAAAPSPSGRQRRMRSSGAKAAAARAIAKARAEPGRSGCPGTSRSAGRQQRVMWSQPAHRPVMWPPSCAGTAITWLIPSPPPLQAVGEGGGFASPPPRCSRHVLNGRRGGWPGCVWCGLPSGVSWGWGEASGGPVCEACWVQRVAEWDRRRLGTLEGGLSVLGTLQRKHRIIRLQGWGRSRRWQPCGDGSIATPGELCGNEPRRSPPEERLA